MLKCPMTMQQATVYSFLCFLLFSSLAGRVWERGYTWYLHYGILHENSNHSDRMFHISHAHTRTHTHTHAHIHTHTYTRTHMHTHAHTRTHTHTRTHAHTHTHTHTQNIVWEWNTKLWYRSGTLNCGMGVGH